jgi:hypothetical protein
MDEGRDHVINAVQEEILASIKEMLEILLGIRGAQGGQDGIYLECHGYFPYQTSFFSIFSHKKDQRGPLFLFISKDAYKTTRIFLDTICKLFCNGGYSILIVLRPLETLRILLMI